METSIQNVSYLSARDPSILTWGRPYQLSNVRRNLQEEMMEQTDVTITSKEPGTLQVYMRMKQNDDYQNLYQIEGNKLICKVPEGAQCVRNIRAGSSLTKIFTFSKIFDPDSDQVTVFKDVVKDKVLNFINGFNYSLLTYGASGSGKTYTIVGTEDEPGIIPRALEYLFRTLPPLSEEPRIKPKSAGGIIKLNQANWKIEKNLRLKLLDGISKNDYALHSRIYRAMQKRLSQETVAIISENIDDISLSVWVSYAEIYNESVYDLLKPDPPRGHQRQKLQVGECNGNAYIKNLTYVNVSSGLEAYCLLQYGLAKLKYAATCINDHSSRSHSIFTIKLAQASDTKEGVSVSSFNFCDLAGSERMKKTKNIGERLKESNNINTSLLVLGRCISMVRDAQKQNENKLIPFRESKLTQLFQKALSGQEAISLVVNVNPTRDMFDESQHVLNFSAIAKDVIVEEQQVIQRPCSSNRMTKVISEKRITSMETVNENTGIEQMQDYIETLESEIEQKELQYKEDRERVVQTYKEIIAKQTEFWEKRCKEQKEELDKYKEEEYKRNLEELQTRELQQRKKRKASVIVLDSSSDEETDRSKQLLKIDPDVEIELADSRLKLKEKDDEITKLQNVIDELATQKNKLAASNIQLQETINELNAYIEVTQMNKHSNNTTKDTTETSEAHACSSQPDIEHDISSFKCNITKSVSLGMQIIDEIPKTGVLQQFNIEEKENTNANLSF